MLNELRVHELALIHRLNLDLSSHQHGLIVLTGETGAGKSIILQAISLLTGARGSGAWVRGDSNQALIEAIFSVRPEHHLLRTLLEEQGLGDQNPLIIRRVLNKEGRSRIFVNDRSITARLAAELTQNLLNIASQHDQQQLLHVRSHLDYLDTYAELWGMRQQFTKLFRRWQQASSELRQMQDREMNKEQQRDFLCFQLEEINKARIRPGEDEALIRERDQLKASEALRQHVGAALGVLTEQAHGAMAKATKHIEQAAALDPQLGPLSQRLASASFELQDIGSQLDQYVDALPADPSRLELITGRLAELKQLQRKYGASLAEVCAFADNTAARLNQLENLDTQIAAQEIKVEEISTEAMLKGAELTLARNEAALRLAAHMEQELASLNFAHASFRVQVSQPGGVEMEGIHANGRDLVEFMFSANPGEIARPLAHIASGGELSRLMLAMKCLLARQDQVETVIFDEVDAGISGQAAEAVAAKISELATHHQVICITHLPQIAARADLHFSVHKQVHEGRTNTGIVLLNQEERAAELARMLDGNEPSAQTLAYAQALMTRKHKNKNA